MEQQLADHDKRLVALEKGQNKLLNAMEIAEVRRDYMEKRFNQVDDKIKAVSGELSQNINRVTSEVKGINGHITKMVWLLITAIFGAAGTAMAVVLTGGFSGG